MDFNEQKECPSCGTVLDDGEFECPSCGEAINADNDEVL